MNVSIYDVLTLFLQRTKSLYASPFGKLSLKTCWIFQDEIVCFTITVEVIRKRYLEIIHSSEDTLELGMNTKFFVSSQGLFQNCC